MKYSFSKKTRVSDRARLGWAIEDCFLFDFNGKLSPDGWDIYYITEWDYSKSTASGANKWEFWQKWTPNYYILKIGLWLPLFITVIGVAFVRSMPAVELLRALKAFTSWLFFFAVLGLNQKMFWSCISLPEIWNTMAACSFSYSISKINLLNRNRNSKRVP